MRLFLSLAGRVLLLMAVFSCGGDSTVDVAAVSAVSISPPSASLLVGGSVQLAATVIDSKGGVLAGRSIAWSTDNVQVATVSNSGLVTAVGSGNAGIYATVEGKTAVSAILVGPMPVTSVIIEPANTTLPVGQSQQFAAILRDANGAILAGRLVLWSTSNVSVATISATTGLVVAVGVGTASITAVSEGRSGSAVVTTSPSPFTSITASWAHACGLTTTATAYCWGNNTYGQLGDGTRSSRATPTAVAGGIRFRMISTGGLATCGVSESGVTYCWGSKLLDWDIRTVFDVVCTPDNCLTTPRAVAGAPDFQQIRVGHQFACGRSADGVVWCWGLNHLGQLGDGTVSSRATPQPVAGSLRFATLDVGFSESCGLTSAGGAFCWGNNDHGQLGSSSTTVCAGLPCSVVPVGVQTAETFASISVGAPYACALNASGRAFCWGGNAGGQLGDGTTLDRPRPTAVATTVTFASIVAGVGVSSHTCALTGAGTALCWGANSAGQLGIGSTSPTPVPVSVIGGLTFSSIAVGSGDFQNSGSLPYSCGVTLTGSGYCWGDNRNGQLGNGTTLGSLVPVRVSNP